MNLISVIVPVYNVENYLERCINSIIKQDYKNLEIILVDDGSTDNSPKICDNYLKIDNRIKVYHKKNGGLSDARNYGLKKAKGKYISFVDSDDYLLPNLYDSFICQIEKTNCDIFIFNYKKVFDKEEKENKEFYLKIETINNIDCLIKLLNNEIDNFAWNKIYSVKVFKNILFPKGINFEDIGTIYKAILNSKKITIVNEAFYAYFQRQNSITNNLSLKSFNDFQYMVNLRYDDLMKKAKNLEKYIVKNKIYCIYNYYIQIFQCLELDILKNNTMKNNYLFCKKNIKRFKLKFILSGYPIKKKFMMFILFYNYNLFYLIMKWRFKR